jgi:hypothetical protein
MPRIGQDLLDCACYLYPDEAAAQRGIGVGGTGFLVGMRSQRVDGYSFPFIVSNKHVTANNTFVRFNTRLSKGVHIEEVMDWHITADHDLAISPAPAAVDFDTIAATMIDTITLASPGFDIRPGDDVFMIGRFIHIDGKLSNSPSVRFGNVSMLPTEVSHPEYGTQESFVVEMRSVCGYSGSPCFSMPSILDLRTGKVNFGLNNNRATLLGVHWGHVTEHEPVQEKIERARVAVPSHDRRVSYVNSNTGMNGVVPAWHVLSMIEHFRPWMTKKENEMLDERGPTNSSMVVDAKQ